MTTGIEVTLSLSEMLNAANVGVIRRYVSFKDSRKVTNGFIAPNKSELSIDIEGACGEIAFAKAVEKYFAGTVNTFKSADVGSRYQVRQTNSHNNKLLIRSGSKPDDIYILVTGTPPVMWVRGWYMAKDAMDKKEWIHDYANMPPAWFVPVSELNPMETLP